jgi:LPXTG-motif cell wall-anchored protein
MIRRVLFIAGLVLATLFMFAGTARAQYAPPPTTAPPVSTGGGATTPTTVSTGGLPRTGSSDTFPAATLGIVLVAGGAVAVGVARHRRHGKSTA